jgi:hypothetical protein
MRLVLDPFFLRDPVLEVQATPVTIEEVDPAGQRLGSPEPVRFRLLKTLP